MLFIKQLVQRVIRPNNDNIYANAVHPGAVHTGQQDQFKEAYGGVFGTLMKAVVVPFMRTPEQGSMSTLWAATSEDVVREGWMGIYFTDPGEVGKETKQADDEGIAKNLWELSEAMVKEKLGEDALLFWK